MTPKRTRAMELLTAVTSWSSSQDSEPARLSASQGFAKPVLIL